MIEQLAKQLAQDLKDIISPNGLESSKAKPLIEAALRKMNLVSREEFDAQTKVLQRTRQQLTALEEKLYALENQNKP